ncbi:MAG TPA: sulfotransferase [Streptosporangiaceae bacterium]|nr:sulfotransferase [Streptosporangiaceae bacterium]
MSTDRTAILGGLAPLLRSLSDSPGHGEDVTEETRLLADLKLGSTGLLNLSGRVQTRFGAAASLVRFYAEREHRPFTDLRVGEIVEYLAGVLDTAGAHPSPPDPCAIIISTGRCGSTLLSDLISEEPETLSVSELSLIIRPFMVLAPRTELSGDWYWAILSHPFRRGPLMARVAGRPAEFRYPENGRYDWTEVPTILAMTLPSVSADPDHLFSVLAEKVPRFPAQPTGAHHRMLLNLLTQLASRRRWVERSGGSSVAAEQLLEEFPEARIVYLTRDVADTARSMSRHPASQLDVVSREFLMRCGIDPYGGWLGLGKPLDISEVPEDMRHLMPDQLTAAGLREFGGNISHHEATCVEAMRTAERALATKKPKHVHRIRYEDLQDRPYDELAKLGEFLGFRDPSGWAVAVAGKVRHRAATPAGHP